MVVIIILSVQNYWGDFMSCTFFLHNLYSAQLNTLKASKKNYLLISKTSAKHFLLLFITCLSQNSSLYSAATAQAQAATETAARVVVQAALSAAQSQEVNKGYCAQTWQWLKTHKEGIKTTGSVSITAAIIIMTSPISGPITFFACCAKGIAGGFLAEGGRLLIKRYFFPENHMPPSIPQPQVNQVVPQAQPEVHVHNHMQEFSFERIEGISFDMRRMDSNLYQLQQGATKAFTEIHNDLAGIHQELHVLGQRFETLVTHQQHIDRDNEQLRNMFMATVLQQQKRGGRVPLPGNRIVVEPFDEEDEQMIISYPGAQMTVKNRQQTEAMNLNSED